MDGYPKTKYPKHGGGSITVNSPEQEKRLALEDWQDFPAASPAEPKRKRKEEPSQHLSTTSPAPSV